MRAGLDRPRWPRRRWLRALGHGWTRPPVMPRTCYFTSVSRQYAAKARILADTLKRHNPGACFVLMCVGEQPPSAPSDAALFDEVLTLDDLNLPNARQLCFKYNVTELCTAVKPAAARRIMDRFGADRVCYLDPDIAVFDSLAALDRLLDDTSILLTPHQLAPETGPFVVHGEILFLKRGVFNGGFFGVRNDDTGRRFLDWWNTRLIDYCLDDAAEHIELQRQCDLLGLFTDQKWLDLVPCLFDRYHVVRDPGCNVCTWNLTTRSFTRTPTGGYLVDGQPLRFFHFSGVDSGAHRTVLDQVVRANPAARDAYEPSDWYLAELARHDDAAFRALPYTYGRYDDGEPIPAAHRRLYAVAPEARVRFPNPFAMGPGAHFRQWAREQVSPAGVARAARRVRWAAAVHGSAPFRFAMQFRWFHRTLLRFRELRG